jgi:hypothetical protein
MSFVETLSDFFDDFAETATLANGSKVFGIFDAAYQQQLNGMLSSSSPQFQSITTSLMTAVEGTAITIAGITYTIVEVQPDGTGLTTLILRRAI